MTRINRNRYLTADESALYDQARREIEAEKADLIARHRARVAAMISHRKLVKRDPSEVARFKAEMAAGVAVVYHDRDQRCCHAESYEETERAIMEADR